MQYEQELGFNANINSDKPLQTTAIFFLSNIYLKQGISYVYVTVEFISMGFLGLQGAEARFIKWKLLITYSGTLVNSWSLDCEAIAVTVRLWNLTHYRQVKTEPVLLISSS